MQLVNQPLNRPIGERLLNAAPFAKRPLTRWFTTYSSALNGYDEFSSDMYIAAGEDFEIEFQIATSSSGAIKTVLGYTPSAADVLMQTNGKLRISDGAQSQAFNTAVNDGKLNTYAISRSSNTVFGYLNGVPDGSGVVAGALTFSRIAAESAGFWDGEIANLKIWKGGNRSTGGLVVDMPLDEPPESTVRVNKAAVLGGEIAKNCLDLTNWDIVGVSEEIIGQDVKLTALDGSYDRGQFAVDGLIVGNLYKVDIKARPGVGGQQYLEQWTFGVIPLTRVDKDKVYSFIVKATATYGVIRAYASRFAGSAGDEIFIGNISIKEIPAATPLAGRFNQPVSQTNSFTQVSDGWEMGLWSYGDTVYDGTEPAYDVVSGDIPGAIIQVGWTVRYSSNYSIDSGSARFGVADLLAPAVTGIGSISGEEVATIATRMSWQTIGVPCIGTSTDTRVKRFLEVAS